MPISRPTLLSRIMGFIWDSNPTSILDVGIGFGGNGVLFRQYTDIKQGRYKHWKTKIDGIEIFEGYKNPIWEYIYNEVIIGNALTIIPKLPKYDIVFLGDVLEHLKKDEALELLNECIKTANKYVIVATPATFRRNLDVVSKWKNPYEEHKCFLEDKDFPKGSFIERHGVQKLIIIPKETKLKMKSSKDKNYWDRRYKAINSGAGSYGQWANFKLQKIKEISDVSSILDVGFGDLNMGLQIASLFPKASYLGLEISETALQRAKTINLHKDFRCKLIENSVFSYPSDLVLCLDVLFHITQDKDYEDILESLKKSWKKHLFLTVYKDECVNLATSPHIKIRKFNPTYFSSNYEKTLIPFGNKNTYLYHFEKDKAVPATISLKEQALKNLIDFKQVMAMLKIQFFLMDGTLLGAYRDKDFIKNDYDDVDIGILAEYHHRAPEIIANLKKRGFRQMKEFRFREKFEGTAMIRNGNHIDFFCIHIKGKEAYNIGRNFLPNNSKPYRAYVYPAHCFEKFDQIDFKGMKFNIPHKVEDYLKARYEDWKTPCLRGEGYNWLDQKQNPGLKANYEI